MPVKIMTPLEAGIPDVGADYVPPDSMPMDISGKDVYGGDWNWGSLAKVAKMTAEDLIRFNYKTTKPEVVNFYLGRNCGCKLTTPDGKNYRFPTASPGIVYIPRITPVLSFYHIPIRPMEMLPGPTPGTFEMAAVFQVHLTLNPDLADPTLYEYRQMIRGSAFQQDGDWDGERWRPRGLPKPVGSRFIIPGTPGVPAGLLTTWKEDGVTAATGTRLYGHRENGNFSDGLEVDRYTPGPLDGYKYTAGDRPGLEGLIRIGQRTSLKIEFLGTVVRFDKAVGNSSRRIVETVAERKWSYNCERTVKIDVPLVPVPTELIPE